MSTAYCWRCAKFVVLVDPDKRIEFEELFRDAVLNAKQFREENGARLEDVPHSEVYGDLYDFYKSLGGDTSAGPHEFRKHVFGFFGPECAACGKNFRTPQAAFCAECGYRPGPEQV